MARDAKPVVVALAGMTIACPKIEDLKRIFTDYFEWDVLVEGAYSARLREWIKIL